MVNEVAGLRRKVEKVSIEPLQPADIEKAAAMMARAFTTEPNNRAVFRGERNMEVRQKPVFRQMLKGFPGTTLVVKKDSAIIGVLCMVPWPQCQMPLLKRLKYLARMFMVLRGGLLREMNIRQQWSKHDPREPHWHMGPIGVEPAFQGKGIGSELMTCFCEKVDTEHQAGYLETDNWDNVRFYQRFGFSATKNVVINGVCNWFMWRPAH